jgi:hypothetical protein
MIVTLPAYRSYSRFDSMAIIAGSDAAQDRKEVENET